MMKRLKQFRLPIALALLLLLTLTVWQSISLLQNHMAHKQRRAAFDAALAQIDPQNTAVSFRVPYDSRLFTPKNIGLGQLDIPALDALNRLLTSMTYDKDGTEACRFLSENVLISAALPEGRMTISIGDDIFCVVQTTTDGIHWDTAAYTYDLTARDDLLICGGLPTIDEMKAVIEQNLQDQLNDLGDSVNEENRFK